MVCANSGTRFALTSVGQTLPLPEHNVLEWAFLRRERAVPGEWEGNQRKQSSNNRRGVGGRTSPLKSGMSSRLGKTSAQWSGSTARRANQNY
jgi:hypothetical protein